MIAVVAKRAEHLRQRQMRQSFWNFLGWRAEPPDFDNRSYRRARTLDNRLAAQNVCFACDVEIFGYGNHMFTLCLKVIGGNRGLSDPVLQPPQAFVAALFDLRPDGLQLGVIGARE